MFALTRLAGSIVLLLVIIGQICIVEAGSFHDVVSVKLDSSDGLELDLGHGKIYDAHSYNKAIIFLEELKGASSCHRLAASTLIQACQSADQNSAIDVALSGIKEEYAAKVAACELSAVYNRGKDIIPKACKAFLPSKKACPKTKATSSDNNNKMCYAHVSRAQITACISGLEGRAQSWTSYSNALQNVHHTCQASRLANDKDLMLDQLKTALSTFADTTAQGQQAFADYQAQATTNLARFQQVHNDVVASVKDDWENLSGDLREHTWKSYLNMFHNIGAHYTNLTERFTHSADLVIQRQDQALDKVDSVSHSLDTSLLRANELATQQVIFHATASANSIELLNKQAQLQTGTEFVLSVMDVMRALLEEEAGSLEGMINSTNELKELVNSTSPLVALLTPLADALHLVSSTIGLVLSVNVLTLICVVTNIITFIYVGKKIAYKASWSLGGLLKVALTLNLMLYLTHLTASTHKDIVSFIVFIFASRLSGVIVMALYLTGAFETPYSQHIKNLMAHRKVAVVADEEFGLPQTLPTYNQRLTVSFAEPSRRYEKATTGWRVNLRGGRAMSEEPTAKPVWK